MFLSPCGDPKRGQTPEQTANFYAFTVARAVKKYGVSFHGGIQMGKHLHNNIITDRLGNRPNFKKSVHGNLARGISARFGRFDGLRSSGGSCDTVTPSDDDTLEDFAYCDCNAMTSGLVKPELPSIRNSPPYAQSQRPFATCVVIAANTSLLGGSTSSYSDFGSRSVARLSTTHLGNAVSGHPGWSPSSATESSRAT